VEPALVSWVYPMLCSKGVEGALFQDMESYDRGRMTTIPISGAERQKTRRLDIGCADGAPV
jgi:hypothetical protein